MLKAALQGGFLYE
jgi:hypothetical protein